jgi:hypothetical protein
VIVLTLLTLCDVGMPPRLSAGGAPTFGGQCTSLSWRVYAGDAGPPNCWWRMFTAERTYCWWSPLMCSVGVHNTATESTHRGKLRQSRGLSPHKHALAHATR